MCVLFSPDRTPLAWWLGQHRDLAMQLPGLKKYAVNLVRVAPDSPEPEYDGVAELWFEKEEDLFAAYQVSQDTSNITRRLGRRDRKSVV